MKRTVFPVLLSLLLISCSVASVGPSETPSITTETKHQIIITDKEYTPDEITVDVGDKVIWINQGSDKFTVTSMKTWIDETSTEYNLLGGTWDSGDLSPGESYSRIFNETGVYEYVSLPLYHWEVFTEGLKGKVIVD